MSPVASLPQPVHVWLRAESKPMEHRSALTPTTAKTLLDNGFKVTVERSPERIFDDAEFERIGATLVESHSWPSAPHEAYILGLKELPETPATPLPHTHIQFAHCYKGQADWDKVLARFPQGGGTLLDLEFLQDEKGRRVAAFGYHAGFAGAAVGLDTWAWQKTGKGRPTAKSPSEFGPIKPYPTEQDLISYVTTRVQEGVKANNGEYPRIMVMGALGRCGSGAVDLAQKVGIPDSHIIKWDLAETKDTQGPYSEIVESDVFVNCIYLSAKIPPFLTTDFINSHNSRKLSVVVDVSCDTTNPNNPIPIYKDYTYFSQPVLQADNINGQPLHVIAIDHLPTMLPREASESFSAALIPSLLCLKERNAGENPPVWKDAEALFNEKVATLPAALRQQA